MQTEKIGIQESVDQLDAPVISSWTLAAEQTHMAMKQLEACFFGDACGCPASFKTSTLSVIDGF